MLKVFDLAGFSFQHLPTFLQFCMPNIHKKVSQLQAILGLKVVYRDVAIQAFWGSWLKLGLILTSSDLLVLRMINSSYFSLLDCATTPGDNIVHWLTRGMLVI